MLANIDKLLKSKTETNKIIKKANLPANTNYILSASLSLEYEELSAGYLEILSDGYGFLRDTNRGKDIYISASQIKKFRLKNSDYILGEVKVITKDKSSAMNKIVLVNDQTMDKWLKRVSFDDLMPHYPDKKLSLGNSISARIIDIIAPIGLGQRGLIVASPKSGKTILLSEIANGIIENNKDVEVWLLLIDERPEEVTDMKMNVKANRVFSSTFDEDPQHHAKVTERVLEQAKTEVEIGKNIIILMDNITRLARAYNLIVPSSGKIISGGLDPYAFVMPKKFFGAARNIKNGGSLTILATALYDTGSKMDDVVYEEFKGTGNLEIHLDRSIAEMRIFPAINIKKSGTRREESFFAKDEMDAIHSMRRYLGSFNEIEAIQKLISLIKENKSNDILLYKFLKNSVKKS
jgi:transcription termination factor Rho